jgi:hypothetical protein
MNGPVVYRFGRSALVCELPLRSPLEVPGPIWVSTAELAGVRVPSGLVVIVRVDGAMTVAPPPGFDPVVAAPPLGFSAVGLAALVLSEAAPAEPPRSAALLLGASARVQTSAMKVK